MYPSSTASNASCSTPSQAPQTSTRPGFTASSASRRYSSSPAVSSSNRRGPRKTARNTTSASGASSRRRERRRIGPPQTVTKDGAPPLHSAAMDTRMIVVLEGDDTGQELLEEALRVLAPDVIGVDLDLPRFDLSLESRRATKNEVVHEAARAVREHGLGLKAATITPEGAGGVGSPNRIL